MEYRAYKNGILLSSCGLDPDATFGCGQCFRFERGDDGSWSGISQGKRLTVTPRGDDLFLSCTPQEFEETWRSFLDLDRDYDEMHRIICRFPVLAPYADAAAGIVILRQEFWEALASFIFSQNNNIPRIRGIVSRFCEAFGRPLEGGGFSFPDADLTAGLSVQQLSLLRCGFRDKYLLDAAEMVAGGEITAQRLSGLSTEEARELLMTIKGVGVKVADCTLLYGCGRMDVFPRDVWIKRICERILPDGLPDALTPYSGIVQQYLYHAGRNLGL